MDTTQLKYFVSLAQSLNFTNVAKQFFVTQPAISHQISRLEENIGAKLFHRTKHHVSLTSEGEAFYHYAIDLLAMSAAAEERIRQITEGKEASLHISAVASTSRALQKCAYLFTQRYPGINVDMDCMTGQQQVMSINKLECDFYFSTSTLLQNMRKLTMVDISKDCYGIFAHKSIAEGIDANNFNTLKNLDLIAEDRANGVFLMEKVTAICREHNYRPPKIRYYSSFMSAQIAISAGMGYGILPLWSADWFADSVVSKPISGNNIIVNNAVAWDSNTMDLPKIAFLEVVREIFDIDTDEE